MISGVITGVSRGWGLVSVLVLLVVLVVASPAVGGLSPPIPALDAPLPQS